MSADQVDPDGRPSDEQLDYLWCERFQNDHRAFARAAIKVSEIGGVRAAASYRAGNVNLLEALMGMVWQFVAGDDRDAPFSHSFMASEEGALRVLCAAGMAVETPGKNEFRLLWSALEARKAELMPQQMTWAEAVNLCVHDATTRERLLAMDDEGAPT